MSAFMKIGFQMCPLDEAKPGYDNSHLLICEALTRGHTVYHFTPDMISLDQTGRLSAPALLLSGSKNGIDETQPVTLDLRDLDVLFFRQDPPFDMAYITNTYLLERLEGEVLFVNHPRWIREMPDKFSIFDYADFMSPTLVSRDPKEIETFFQAHNHDVVAKPLYGFKGHGIERLSSPAQALDILAQTNEPLMFQPFLPEIKEGNKRIVLFNGEIVGALKTVPDGDFRIYRDSQDIAYTPTADEIAFCEKLAPLLRARGLIFVGLDLIGSYLTEINVGSVGSLVRLNQIYNDSFDAKLFDCVEALLNN
jgi:glutathione synthase